MPTSSAPRRRPLIARERDLGLRRSVVTTALGRIVVRAGGSAGASATLMLHGAAGSWTTWTPLIAASDRCGTPLTDVIAIDLPGWGDSGALPEAADVGDLSAAAAEVARSLGYASWHVIGHSLGGFVALDLAVREPAATLSVTLVSPSGAGVVDAVRRAVRGGMRLPGFAGMLLAMRLLAMLGSGARPFLRALARTGLLRALAAPLFAHSRKVHRSVTDALAEEIRPASFVRAARRAAVYDLDLWRRITAPVRSVRGERDVFAGRRDAVAFATLIPDFHETPLRGAGHFAHIEQPDAVLAVLTAARAAGQSGGSSAARTAGSRHPAIGAPPHIPAGMSA